MKDCLRSRDSKFIYLFSFSPFFFFLPQVQFWVETQVLLTQQLNKRVYLLKKFIKLAAQ